MKAIVKSVIAIGAFAGLAVAASAQVANPRSLTLSKSSKLWIEGTSTVKSFTCTATRVDVDVLAEPGSPSAELVSSAALTVPVASLECGNGTMNDHMRKALKADRNPAISWKMASYKVDGTAVTMTGRLSIAGKENPIELRATGTADPDGTVRIKGSTKFNMTQYGVKPPSLMLGTMKVGDPVTVSFDFVLTP